MLDTEIFHGCQLCAKPCFQFYEKIGVCPDEIGLVTQEQRETYLSWLEENSVSSGNEEVSLLDPDDCCPHLEKIPP